MTAAFFSISVAPTSGDGPSRPIHGCSGSGKWYFGEEADGDDRALPRLGCSDARGGLAAQKATATAAHIPGTTTSAPGRDLFSEAHGDGRYVESPFSCRFGGG